MTRTLSAAVATVAFAVALAGANAFAAPDLALKRVMLSTGGVATYEHEAQVEGDAVLELDVRLDQVDDILKSLVVLDETGAVGAIRLPGREPLRQVFRDLPFDEADLSSPLELLSALQGAEVEVAGARPTRGRLIAVTPETAIREREGETITRHRVALMTAEGIQQFVLEEATGIRFTDPRLAQGIQDALAATARHRVMDRRTVEIEVKGKAKRLVRVAYVVAAPLWKTAYRLTLVEGAAKGRLQGWAVLENQSGHDWNGVELTLTSGNPVTFRQSLYESYAVDRPEVPVEVAGRVLPRVDAGAMAVEEKAAPAEARERDGGAKSMYMMREAAPAMAPVPMLAPGAPPPARGAAPAEAREAAALVLFRLPQPVTVAAGQSLSIPIVDRDVPAARVALYQRATSAVHPLAAVRMLNDGGAGLPAGILTVYERPAKAGATAFVGDARVGALPKGEERYASFALDQRVRVDAERIEETAFQRASVGQGVLRVFNLVRQGAVYRVEGPKGAPFPVVVEHPRLAGWTLAEPDPKAVAMTPDAFRVTIPADAEGKGSAKVMLERVDTVRYQLVDLASDRLVALSRHGDMPEAMRKAFAEAARLRTNMEAAKRAAEDLEKERAAIEEDQERIRANLESVPEGSDLQSRYLRKMTEQEDRMDAIGRKREETERRLQAARDELAAYLNGLNF